MFVKRIEKLKKIQKRYVETQKQKLAEIKDMESQLEKYISRRWKETFGEKQVHFLPGLQGGCLAGNWNPEVYFYSVGNYEYCNNAFYDLTYEDEISYNLIATKVKSPIPMNQLRKFLKDITAETGVKCVWSSSSYIRGHINGKSEL